MKYKNRIRQIDLYEKKAEKKRAKRKLKVARLAAESAMRVAEINSEIWYEDAQRLVDKLNIEDDLKADAIFAIMTVASWETTAAGIMDALMQFKEGIKEIKERLPRFVYRSEEDQWVLDPADMAARARGEPEPEPQSD